MFPSENRLRRQKDVETTVKKGRGSYDPFIGVKAVKNNLKQTRFAVIAGVKAAKQAAARNYFKRMIRNEAYKYLDSFADGYDIVIIARPGIENAGYSEIASSILKHFQRLKLLKKQSKY